MRERIVDTIVILGDRHDGASADSQGETFWTVGHCVVQRCQPLDNAPDAFWESSDPS